MTVLLALSGAVFYGLSDFVGGITSRRTSAWSVAFVASVTGAGFVLIGAWVLGGDPTGADLGWGLAAGIGNGFGTAFLYRGLSSGRMGVVAPISGVGAALVPVVVGLLGGERPGTLVWLGVLAALPGIWLVSREPASHAPADGPAVGRGVLDGVLAGLGFGSLFAALGQIPEDAGLLPLALNQVVASVAIILIATGLGVSWRPREPRALVGAVCGLLGAAATIAFLLAVQRGALTTAAILASLYPAVTILLAAGVLKERIHRGQAVGLLLCGVAVALVAAG
ncbi:EamA family transporter [Nocardioides donggukensis]|uniref:DMT family transporter n=1 Tax=Nocardioides donggukensis TaxID=2774019 RepID=A0A927K8C9_9ACTN|nr:EamA family transporter [Nocardioides donggukensis]MBD8869651.1 DMT family transporter [Nocardioides donggukensis]